MNINQFKTKNAMETKFEDETQITPYLASAYAEGFCEGEGASQNDQVRAWSYLIGTGLAYSLQGWYGRTANSMIEDGLFEKDGTVNWEYIDSL